MGMLSTLHRDQHRENRDAHYPRNRDARHRLRDDLGLPALTGKIEERSALASKRIILLVVI